MGCQHKHEERDDPMKKIMLAEAAIAVLLLSQLSLSLMDKLLLAGALASFAGAVMLAVRTLLAD